MEWINRSISNYQEIIGAYEKQVWERSLEKAVLKTFSHENWKRAKVNLDLIDVDLVRGSTFSKTKPQQGWVLIVKRTFIRALLLPFCYQWWKSSTSWFIFWLLSLLYSLQVASFITYFTDADDAFGTESLSLAHLFSPFILLLVVALVQTQVIETSRPRDSPSPHCKTPITKGARNKKKVQQQNGIHMVSEHASVGSHDTGIDSNPDDVCADHASSGDGNPSYFQETKSSPNDTSTPSDTTAPSDVDNDSSMVYNNDAGHHVTDADDESDDSVTVAKDTLNSVSHTKRASFEKTSAWVQQIKLLHDTSSADVAGLTSKGTKEVEGAKNPVLLQGSSGLFRRPNSSVSLNGYMLLDEERRARHSLSENDTDIVSDEDSCLRHRKKSVSTNYNDKLSQKKETVDYTRPISKNLTLNTEETDFHQLTLLLDAKSYQDKGLVSHERESKGVRDVARVISFDSEVHKHCPGSCVGLQKASTKPSKSQKESTIPLMQKKNQMREGSAYQNEQLLNGKQQKLKNVDGSGHVGDAAGGDCGVTSTACGSVSEFSDNDMTASDDEDKSAILNNLASENSKVGCFVWDSEEVERVDMTGLEISSHIIKKVESSPDCCDDILLGFGISGILMLIPIAYRVYHSRDRLVTLDLHSFPDAVTAFEVAVGHNWRQMVIIMNGLVQRFCFGLYVVLLLSVAERNFKQRLLFAKNFCYLTSLRRSKKYNLPHFRLNKVRNIKTWLSVRSFLKRRGPQRSAETIVSDAFIASVVIVSVISVQLLQDGASFLDELGNWELVLWFLALGIYLLKFVTLGSKINRKYHNSSVLITEQINLYLQMEQKPNKKDELMMANSVLRLAEDLLKDLEGPFKISGLSANPLLYNITKVVVLSAFSAVLTELLGFKLKLYKINLRT